jgi:twinkle protein
VTNASLSKSSTTARSSSATTAGFMEASSIRGLSPAAIAWARDVRKISARTLERLSVTSGMEYFPRRLERESQAVYFPYQMDGALANWKGVAFPEKDFIGMKGGKLCLLNIDLLLSNSAGGDLFIVEGEFDVCAMVEAGFPVERVTTVPNGGRERKEGDEDRDPLAGNEYLRDAEKRGLLKKFKRIIWCGDTDSTGYSLRQDIAAIWGAAKLWFMDWPEGIKDANEMLIKEGPQALREYVEHAPKPWPIDGLYSLSDLPELPPIKPWYVPKLEGLHNRILFAPGTMSVVTGHPGHGKTQFMAQVWHDIAERNDLIVATATFETRAKPHYRRILRTLHSGRLEKHMVGDEVRAADHWINQHYLFMQHPDQKPDLDWFLKLAEVAVIRHGAKVIQLDPWNRLESARDDNETETEYIGRCLTALYVFAQQFDCHVQILAHPTKMDSRRKGQPPELDDIAGSKHWDNRVDQGIVVHRPEMYDDKGRRCTKAVVIQKKSRFEELGHPCRVELNYRLDAGRYEDFV